MHNAFSREKSCSNAMPIDVRTVQVFHSLNPDWSIQSSVVPAICKEVLVRINLLFSAVVNQPLNSFCTCKQHRHKSLLCFVKTLSTVEMYIINCNSYFCNLVIWIHDIEEFLSRVSDVPMSELFSYFSHITGVFLSLFNSLDQTNLLHIYNVFVLLSLTLYLSFISALHLAVINSQQEVVQCLIDIMAGLPESYISEYNFLRQVSHAIYHMQCKSMIYMMGTMWYFVALT